jgi:hypothetical protein
VTRRVGRRATENGASEASGIWRRTAE